jgi:hypothetical protein
MNRNFLISIVLLLLASGAWGLGWWNSSYSQRILMNCSNAQDYPIAINGSVGFIFNGTKQTVWILCSPKSKFPTDEIILDLINAYVSEDGSVQDLLIISAIHQKTRARTYIDKTTHDIWHTFEVVP